jgi:hypothetical protein
MVRTGLPPDFGFSGRASEGFPRSPPPHAFIPPKRTHSLNLGHVGLLADRHRRSVCANSSLGLSTAGHFAVWTVDRVITELPWLGPLDQRESLVALSGQRDELSQALRRALQTCDGSTGLNAAVMLLKLQDPAGRDVFLEALRGTTNAAREALSFLRLDDLAPHDTNDKDPYHRKIKVPILEPRFLQRSRATCESLNRNSVVMRCSSA